MYPLTTKRLNILVRSHHIGIRHVQVNDLLFGGTMAVQVIIKLRWWCWKRKFINNTLPEIKETIGYVQPIGVAIKYEIK